MLWNGIKCRKTKVMGMSRELFPVRIMIDQKQLENVEYFRYLASITNNARSTRELNPGIPCLK
jgi:hypothetical protein